MASDVSISPARAEEPLVLALDIGTSSVRAVFFDRMGRILEDCMARHPVALLTSPDGTAIIEADALFATTCRCVDEALTALISLQLSEALPIVGVGICSFVSNVLGVDSDGGAITPIFTYADTRPARDMAALQTIADEGAVHQRTGCHFHPSYLPARFIWLARTQPELLRMNLRWMSFGEFLILRLFGETSVSYSTASWSGLLDRHQMAWDQELLRILPINLEQLSPLVDVDQPWRGLRQDF